MCSFRIWMKMRDLTFLMPCFRLRLSRARRLFSRATRVTISTSLIKVLDFFSLLLRLDGNSCHFCSVENLLDRVEGLNVGKMGSVIIIRVSSVNKLSAWGMAFFGRLYFHYFVHAMNPGGFYRTSVFIQISRGLSQETVQKNEWY